MNSNDALISIIIPVYNVAGFLDKCVESVCNQTYEKLEIILVDDGSTDGSGELCDKWKEKDSRILVIHKANGGISDARNAALDIAKGDYIGFVDSDDSIAPEMYESLLQKLNQTESDLVVCAYKAVDENGNPCTQIYEDIPDCTLSVPEYIEMMNQNVRNHCTLVVVWNKLYRRCLLENVRFRVGTIHEDDFFMNEILPQVSRIEILHDRFYYYMQRSNSIMHVQFSEKRLAYFYALRERLKLSVDYCYGERCIGTVARECIQSGVRFWMLIAINKNIDDQKSKQFYKDVREVKREYSQYGTFRQKAFWTFFDRTPWLLKTLYGFYKSLKKEKI